MHKSNKHSTPAQIRFPIIASKSYVDKKVYLDTDLLISLVRMHKDGVSFEKMRSLLQDMEIIVSNHFIRLKVKAYLAEHEYGSRTV